MFCALSLPNHRSGPRRRRTAAEIHQIFDVPCRSPPLEKELGAGAFGVGVRSHTPSGCVVAIKRVAQDENYVNHEAKLCKMFAAGNHPKFVEVKGVYFTADQGRTINLVLGYVPQTMRNVLSFLYKRNMRMKSPCV